MTGMIYRPLGRTGLQVSLAGLGSGGPSELGQATHGNTNQALRLIRRALDLGVNLFDTAPVYGDSEKLLGRALKGVPRDRYVLATKVRPETGPGRVLDPKQVTASADRSLRRLGVEAIDLYQFHGVKPRHYPAVVERLYPALLRLKEAGKVRFLGITETAAHDPTHQMLAAAVQADLWDTIMVKYGILNQAAAQRVLPAAHVRNIGVLNMASVRIKLTRPAELQALIAGHKARGLPGLAALPATGPLDFLIQGPVDSVVSAGYKFAALPEAVSSVLVGTGSLDHLEANVNALLGPPLPAEHVARLRELFGGLAESQ